MIFFLDFYFLLENNFIFFIFFNLSYIFIALYINGYSNFLKKIIYFLIFLLLLFIICYIIYIIYFFFINHFITTIHCCSSSSDTGTVNATVNVNISKKGAEAIASGLQSTGSQIGLGAAIGGLAAAASKSLAGSALPPIQKIGLISVAGVIGALAHSGATAINRGLNNSIISSNSNNKELVTSTSSNDITSSLVSSSELQKSIVADSPLDSSIFNLLPLSFDFNNPPLRGLMFYFFQLLLLI